MTSIDIALIAEGTSDAVLTRPIKWLCSNIAPQYQYDIRQFDFRNLPSKPSLTEKVCIVLRDQPRHLIIIHRDQDNTTRESRTTEITQVINNAKSGVQLDQFPEFVPVIPVKMSETWFLIDEQAIKKAAGFATSKASLDLPAINKLESVSNPKELLFQLMKDASGLTGRRLKKFKPQQKYHLLADLIQDYSVLDKLPAFAELRKLLQTGLSNCSSEFG